MRSSYEDNHYDNVFYSIVIGFKPLTCVELGVLDGYSTCAIARGLKKNQYGSLEAYDLWEDYPYKHGEKKDVQNEIDKRSLTSYIALQKGDAYEVYKKYLENSIYLLHIDISNTGDVVKQIMELWDSKIVIGGLILFEGGTEERDQVDWMIRYKMPPIKPEIETNPIIEKKYVFGTYLDYPGLTCLLKKRDD